MEFQKELNDLVQQLNTEIISASKQGYSTVTLTNDEVAKITSVLSHANERIVPQRTGIK